VTGRKFEIINGEGRDLKDTRPPAARLGRHTLPDMIVAIRRFVAEHGFLPPEVQAELQAASRPPEPEPEERTWPLWWVAVGIAGLVVLAGVVFALRSPSESAQASPPAASLVPPPPLESAPVALPVTPPSTAASREVPQSPRAIEPARPTEPKRVPRQSSRPPLQSTPQIPPPPAQSSAPVVPTIKQVPMDI